jgi:large subunit ribosomal protein L14
MKALASNVVKGLTQGSKVECRDNSGAKELYIIGTVKAKGTRKRYPAIGVGSVAICSVRKGTPEMIKKVVKALIIRQKKEFRRANGWRVSFEDNAAVLITDDGLPVGTEVKGVVAREVFERFPKVSAISAGII